MAFCILCSVRGQNLSMPALTYSTYLGGGLPDDYGESGYGLAEGADGYIYVVGNTRSAQDFPFTQRLLTNNSVTGQGTFVGKFDPTNRVFVYVSFLPAADGVAVAADAAGNAYVCGSCSYLLTTVNPEQGVFGGADYDGFVAKLSPDGAQALWVTFLGGSSNDLARAIALDPQGNVVVTGITESPDFPSTGSGVGPALPGGWNAFVSKFTAAGDQLLASTLLGGAGEDYGMALAVDGAGGIYIAGETGSTNFLGAPNPVILGTNGPMNAFVAKLTPDLGSVVYLTILGGKGSSLAAGLAVDALGRAHLFGQTSSTSFPVTTNAAQAAYAGGNEDDFVAVLPASGDSLLYGSYLGGSGDENLLQGYYIDSGYTYLPSVGAALDGAGNFFVAGRPARRTWPRER